MALTDGEPGEAVTEATDTALGDEALALLQRLTANPHAAFHDDQRGASEALVGERRRVLLVQRTGWGKSVVYFLATRILRDAGAGPTLLISPLLALVRNQLAMAERLGIRAHTIHSQNIDDWNEAEADLAADRCDVLLVSPERLGNPDFVRRVLPLVRDRLGLFV
ncbi:MAG: DEAD/DEAH box helicase, partial [Ilumatobacteraceae bacterium]